MNSFLSLSSYKAWYFNLDPDFLSIITAKRLWIFILVFVLISLLMIIQYVPVDYFFTLDFNYPLIFGLLALLGGCAWLLSVRFLRTKCSWLFYASLLLSMSLVFQLLVWSIVAYSVFPEAAILFAFPIILSAYHGMLFQASWESPYAIIITLLAIVFAGFITPNTKHLLVIGIVGALSLGAAFLMGSLEKKRIRLRKKHHQLRSLIDTQLMLDSVKKIDDTTDIMNTIKKNNHDACNKLSSILMDMSLLSVALSRTSATHINELWDDISQSIQQLKKIIENSRDVTVLPEKKSVAVLELIETCADEFCQVYPDIKVTLHNIDAQTNNLSIYLWGGKTTLYHIVMHILMHVQQSHRMMLGNSIKIGVKINPQSTKLTLSFVANAPQSLSTGFSVSPFSSHSCDIHLNLYKIEHLINANAATIKHYPTQTGGTAVDVIFRKSENPLFK